MDHGASGFRNLRVLPGVLVFLAALLIAGCSGSQPIKVEAGASDNAQPNIILIVTDDLDYALAQQMDGLDSLLRKEGVSFGNAFVSYPLCCPSRATVLTGLYAHNHQVWGTALRTVASKSSAEKETRRIPWPFAYRRVGIGRLYSANTSTSTPAATRPMYRLAGMSGMLPYHPARANTTTI